ncbi:hypothetical protein GCM10010393_44200 [Streptomyces gobitricini]|uniref:Uncharacterized protein n=1 Tax=Streptomyces gobitricini TaxID=68211 RepID=A0ABN3MSX0_9ACTN
MVPCPGGGGPPVQQCVTYRTLHCLLLGCARHLPASCGSSGSMRRGARGVPAAAPHMVLHLFFPDCPPPNMARTDVSPGGWQSLVAS